MLQSPLPLNSISLNLFLPACNSESCCVHIFPPGSKLLIYHWQGGCWIAMKVSSMYATGPHFFEGFCQIVYTHCLRIPYVMRSCFFEGLWKTVFMCYLYSYAAFQICQIIWSNSPHALSMFHICNVEVHCCAIKFCFREDQYTAGSCENIFKNSIMCMNCNFDSHKMASLWGTMSNGL